MVQQASQLWAKTTQDGKPGISVFEHMLNVGCVARCLAEFAPELLTRFQFQSPEVGALSALHDLGKISPGFQRKCETWLQQNGLETVARNGCWDTSMEPDHGKVTHATVQPFLVSLGMPRRSAAFIATALGAHHGQIKSTPNERGYSPNKLISEDRSGIPWGQIRTNAAKEILKAFSCDLSQISVGEGSPGLWWLAGLTTVADWVGSDERYFPPAGGLADEKRFPSATQAIAEIGFTTPLVTKGLSFDELFGFPTGTEPNDVQTKAIAAITGPGVYVIEAPMGMGKTEAALWAAYELLSAGEARGIYFALPTQATSNRIHLRMDKFVKRIAPDTISTRLIHGNSWLMESSLGFRPAPTNMNNSVEDARVGRDWFASSKRALLAPFGVGTVDQALLGVVAAKHFFVRHFALAGKVVILDEVHSYDLYTGTLIDRLVATLKGLGCTVIVLSATLTGKRRGQIVSLPTDGEDDPATSPYPIITGTPEDGESICVQADPPNSREVDVAFLTAMSAVGDAIELASRGGVVLWICNTVGAAQEQYQKLSGLSDGRFPIGLLHSRFPFWRREELENKWMELLGKNGKTRCGSILVSTQIVEQSVDLDADLLITELAPTDMLLQRMGRLWRHERSGRPSGISPRLCILEGEASLESFHQMDSNAIVRTLGGKAHVYLPYVLLRSLEVWKCHERVSIPSQIRNLIEATYKEREHDPDAWRKLSDEGFGKEITEKFMASRNCNLWQPVLEDQEGVQTRLNDVPMVALVLCHLAERKIAQFIDGKSAVLEGKDFLLATAQAIHGNLVKIPKHHFDSVVAFEGFEPYLHGDQTLGKVHEDGSVLVKGLKANIHLRWSTELGLVISKNASRSQE